MWYMTEERQMLQKMMEEFVQNEIVPFIPEMEKNDTYPREIFRKLGQMGILGLCSDPEYGGQGRDFVSFGIALEEISKASNVMGLLTCLNADWIAGSIAPDCTPEQVEKYIKPAIAGEKILAGYCTEPCGIFNFPEYQTVAVPDGEDAWIVNGTKVLGTNNGVCDAFFFVCRTGEVDPMTMQGATMFMIEADREGVKFGRNEHKLGWHGSNTGTLYLDNVRVTKADLVGQLDGAVFSQYFKGQTDGLGDYGIMGLGSCEKVWNQTRKFLGERIQQGKSLWDTHQHIRITMAEMWMQIENLRSASYAVLEGRNAGEDVFGRGVALKTEAVRLLREVTAKCIILHGGTGTVVETDIERYYRDSPMISVGCGSIMTLADQLTYRI